MRSIQVIHRQVEEALNLGCVQVHRDDVISTRHGQHVCHQFGRDRCAALRWVITLHRARNNIIKTDQRVTRMRGSRGCVDDGLAATNPENKQVGKR